MSTLLDDVRHEIVTLHEFFVEWFNGTTEKDQLELRFLSRLDKNIGFIAPEGTMLSGDNLSAGFKTAYGVNKDFRIQIRDVEIRHETDEHILATYTEWQAGAKASENTNNARITTVLMSKEKPFKWLHIQETWLPEAVRSADPFDF